jgi:hypothetical protein
LNFYPYGSGNLIRRFYFEMRDQRIAFGSILRSDKLFAFDLARKLLVLNHVK